MTGSLSRSDSHDDLLGGERGDPAIVTVRNTCSQIHLTPSARFLYSATAATTASRGSRSTRRPAA
jgi:hypothetical protein